MNTEVISALVALTGMEIILGFDNIIFIAILVSKLPKEQQARTRSIGIAVALISRLILLFSISWIMGLSAELFSLFDRSVSGRDLILVLGGLFLVGKATFEIHERIEGAASHDSQFVPLSSKTVTSSSILLQIVILDIVFSLDSVITAVGMAQQLWIMITAMLISVIVMLLAAARISSFVEKHPTVKILALAFLMLIGGVLVMEGSGEHVNKGTIYFAMAFSFIIEMLNLRVRKKA